MCDLRVLALEQRADSVVEHAPDARAHPLKAVVDVVGGGGVFVAAGILWGVYRVATKRA